MEIVIDLEALAEVNLTPTWYSYLLSIHTKSEYPCANKATQLKYAEHLQKEGWCKIIGDEVVLRQKTIDFINDIDTSPSNVISWIEEWRDLWPKGIKSGNRPVRGDKQGIAKKMRLFCKEHPKIIKKDIFDATKIYIFEARQNNYRFMTCADYFIKKDGVSLLAAKVEEIEGKTNILDKIGDANSSSFHKEV